MSLVRTVGGDGDTLPLGAPVLDPVESDDRLTLDPAGEVLEVESERY